MNERGGVVSPRLGIAEAFCFSDCFAERATATRFIEDIVERAVDDSADERGAPVEAAALQVREKLGTAAYGRRMADSRQETQSVKRLEIVGEGAFLAGHDRDRASIIRAKKMPDVAGGVFAFVRGRNGQENDVVAVILAAYPNESFGTVGEALDARCSRRVEQKLGARRDESEPPTELTHTSLEPLTDEAVADDGDARWRLVERDAFHDTLLRSIRRYTDTKTNFVNEPRERDALVYWGCMKQGFIHLHTHSHYSLLQALPKIPDLVGAAKDAGMEALALTDAGNLYGAIEFYKKCKAAKIKPIIGVDAYVAARTRFDKEATVDTKRSRLVLLAKDKAGYQNLLKLVTASNLEGFYYKPRMDRELLARHADGLIAILPSLAGEHIEALRGRDAKRAAERVAWYAETFGKGNVYLEITHHPEIDGHQSLQNQIKKLSLDTSVPLVAAHDVYYLKSEDRQAREVMVRIQGALLGDATSGDGEEDFSFITREQARAFFKDTPGAIENTGTIADACNLELKLGTWVFPAYPQGDKSYEEELRALVYAGATKRAMPVDKEAEKRVEYELSVINSKGFAPYFLVVADLLRFARERNILATTRGSAAGSLVSYLVGITNVDPIRYKLPFERFLNPERPKAPDIDMDFADDRRDEMIEYAKNKYGESRVAQIGTFGTMMARAAVRDIARALGYPYGVGDRIAKIIPFGSQGFPMTIDKALESVPELAEAYKKEPQTKEIIDLAKKMEGCARHISIHAAGVVIAPSELSEYVPLQFDPKGENHIITQYDMHSVEDAGLLKFDFLGIKNLSILADSVRRVKEDRAVVIDIENIPLDDKKTFEMLARGETMGLFQLNGDGMTRFLKELRPSTIHDINAMVALYRPGPMDVIPQYIERKHNPHLITYLDPRMKDYLQESYGLLVYQDDLLLSALTLAGYSWLELDNFRKAIGKKIPAEMAAQKEKFIKGIVENGQTPLFAEKLWKLFEPFQAYGFNKAHAASYGKVAYQTAYMKANFPTEYMAALLTADAGDVEKVAEAVNECKRLGIPVLPPDVNESVGDFAVILGGEKDQIRFGLHSIKNFGEGIANAIIEERTKGGRYTSLLNFLERIHDKNLNKRSLESLIMCGALDSLNEERSVMLHNIDRLLTYNKESTKGHDAQDSLFALMAAPPSRLALEEVRKASAAEKLAWEKELLGLYVSGHPLDKHRLKLAKRGTDIKRIKAELREGMVAVVAGIIEEIRPILTKGGEHMAFVRLADFSDKLEVVMFPRVMAEFKDLIVPEGCIAIKGRLSHRNDEVSLITEAIKPL